ncbi:unnamed protein product [Rotaria sordida]|uniref:RNA polymerase II subunit B1 CTD phosphatase RPAP2 homolog n=1 Tax=Rotaria sordida TaxID=392033 RepID=A0A813UXB6_9BILA|nr:unnamed protein product [Rotaria sordida]CAF0832112.1 unnamed protein product [Rotaria sordida]CAF3536335.1 unnamed protein product [Rotaria sordida]CAF3596629.1 unnamed protein product [Rotaria sordida]
MATAELTKIDAFRAKIEQRKACEKKAYDTCMQLIEEDKVDNETLINAATLIDQERYRGVNEDRALRQICGYPICSTSLPKDIPTHQYHINVKVNKVIDTTERRLFCSTFCYKSSKYFERQIPTSPVWARQQQQQQQGNTPIKIELLTHENLNKEQHDSSTIISQSNYNRSMPKIPHRHESSSSSSDSDDDEFEKLEIARDNYYKSRATLSQKKPTLVETKLKQISLPDYIRTDNTTIDFVIICLYEWITNKTKDYLQNNTIISDTQINPQRYQQLVNKLDIEDMMSSDGSRAEKKLPTIDELQRTQPENQYEIKVKEFFFGKSDTSKEEITTLSSAIILPPIDAYSQQTIRLSIVSQKIMTCFKQMFYDNVKQTIAEDLRSALSELLLTLSFNSESIALKSNEWTIMTLFLIHLLTIKLPMLLSHLPESKIIQSLLTTLNLSSDTILYILKYLLENPIENQQSLNSITNFEDID